MYGEVAGGTHKVHTMMDYAGELVRSFEREYYDSTKHLSVERLEHMRTEILNKCETHAHECQHCGYFLAALGIELRDYQFVLSTLDNFDLRPINKLTKEWKRLKIVEWTAAALIMLGKDEQAVPLVNRLAEAHAAALKRPPSQWKDVEGHSLHILAIDPDFPDVLLNVTEKMKCGDTCVKAIRNLVHAADLEQRYSKYGVMRRLGE
jgi:hypothetical protein